MANDKRDVNPLIRTVDTLLRRSREGIRGEEVPVLTQLADAEGKPAGPARVDPAALDALARILEQAVRERLGPEIDRIVEERVARTLAAGMAQARRELDLAVTQLVREAVAASVARALGQREPK